MMSIDPERLARVFQSWSVSEVLEVLMEQYILSHAENLDTEKWRHTVLYTQCVAQVFDEFLPLVRRLFDRYACTLLEVVCLCCCVYHVSPMFNGNLTVQSFNSF